MERTRHHLRTRLTALLLSLVCILGLLPVQAFAAAPSTIKLEEFGHYGVSYESAKQTLVWIALTISAAATWCSG